MSELTTPPCAVATDQLIIDLCRPEAYPHRVEAVEVIQTHASVVFLAGSYAYKVKKPHDFGFLDYSTLERRLMFCHAEVKLNERLAHDIYRGVVPLTLDGGDVRVGGDTDPVEYAVKMRRLPEAATLRDYWKRGALTTTVVREVGRTIAAFHRERLPDSQAAHWSAFEEVERNHDDNFVVLADYVGSIVSRDVYERLKLATQAELSAQANLIRARASDAIACDGHGDLRTDHVYIDAGIESEDAVEPRIDVVDCIEFDARYRCGDPISDIAFLAVDLLSLGASELAEILVRAYLDETKDEAGAKLLPLYRGYRATVRAKVEAIRSSLAEVPQQERAKGRARAQAWALLAIGELEPPRLRPGLVLLSGLPASGKSTVAAVLADRAGFVWIRADEVRKRLAGLDPTTSAPASTVGSIYSAAWSARTYAACLEHAKRVISNGGRAIVDATFLTYERRRPFVDAAVSLGCRVVGIVCTADEQAIRKRLSNRRAGPSDADYAVYRALADQWEEPRDATIWRNVSTVDSHESTVGHALAELARSGLS